MLKNCMEDIVEELLPLVINEREDICKCESCIKDMKAIALNHLPPRYAATSEGALYVKVDKSNLQSKVDVLREITKAVEIVCKNPKHRKNFI